MKERYERIVKENDMSLNEKLEFAFALQYREKVFELINQGADKSILRKVAQNIGGWKLTILQCDILKELDV